MQLWDRVAGVARAAAEIDLLEPGRYLLLSAWQYNGHTQLEEGEVLLDDGSTRLQFPDGAAEFVPLGEGGPSEEEFSVALDAVTAIAKRSDLDSLVLPSPLIPPELAREVEQSNLELVLHDVLEAGHLEAIAARPRQTMRYDSELMPVARARRLDNGFQRHLAAHSECWARQTISGIVPKRVLARVSEDEANIYENRVYCRLLDHLARFIKSRISRLARIGETYRKALKFEGSEAADFRLRGRICATWGEAFDELGDDLEELLRRNDEQLQRLRRWLRRIRALQRSPLYAAVPRTAQVGLNIHATNLLLHDSHYRQVRRLWMAWLSATASERQRRPQVLDRRRMQQRSYEEYVGITLLRVLRDSRWKLATSDDGGWRATHPSIGWLGSLQITRLGHGWQLKLDDELLELVPAAVALDYASSPEWQTRREHEQKRTRVPCVLWAPSDADVAENPGGLLSGNSPALLLSPLDLYSEERLGALVSAWIWRLTVAGYGQTYPTLPQPLVDAWPAADKGVNGALSLRHPLALDQRSALGAALQDHVRRDDLRTLINARIDQLAHLARCPVCETRARLFSPTESGFYSECDCGYGWKLESGCFDAHRRGQEPPDSAFRAWGREWVCVECG